jgi:hypothetical protein
VDKVRETCVDPSGGNRDAAPPKVTQLINVYRRTENLYFAL